MIPLPIRPAISLPEILGYSFLGFIIALLLTKPFLNFLHKYKLGKQLRVEAVDGGSASVFLTYHQKKAGVPTMGGLLIWGSIVLTVVFSRLFSLLGTVDHSLLQRGQVYIPLFTLISFGILGAFDDYINIMGGDEAQLKKCLPWLHKAFWIEKFMIHQGKRKGLGAMPKLISLIGISLFCAVWFYVRLDYHTLYVPFGSYIGLASNTLDIGWAYVLFFVFVVIGTANAVNVTDGLDGLASGLLIIAFGAFGLLAYISGLYVLAGFCGVVVGTLAAFLWHNIPPAAFFMGDTGSLALGGTLAIMAFMTNQVLILPLIGFVFVIEMLSVIIQLTSKKFRNGKKVFKSAPFHHHLEALNWGESKVTMRLWIIGGFFAFLGVLVGIYG